MELIKLIDVTERPAAFCRRAGAPRRRAGTTLPGVPGGGRARLQGPGRNAARRVALLRSTMGGLGAGPLLARARDFVGPTLLWRKKAAGHCTRTCSSTPTPDGLEGPVRRRSYWSYVRRLVQGAPEPPYLQVCQVGDPALRAGAAGGARAAAVGAAAGAGDAAPALRRPERPAARGAAAGASPGVPRGPLPRLRAAFARGPPDGALPPARVREP